jgi:methionyl-tRNA synthetase
VYPSSNQFLTLNNEGFSKSFGVTLDPRKIVADFGLDIVRFYLCLIMPENSDSDFSWDDFIVKTNNLLIANLGNFINRTLTLGEKLDFSNININTEYTADDCEAALVSGNELMSACKFREYAENILNLASFGNKYLSAMEPWKVKKENQKEYEFIMSSTALVALTLMVLIKPIMPDTSKLLSKMIGIDTSSWLNIDDLVKQLKNIKISNPEPLFKKIEADPEKENFNEKYK